MDITNAFPLDGFKAESLGEVGKEPFETPALVPDRSRGEITRQAQF
jgi:hypothetical protein